MSEGISFDAEVWRFALGLEARGAWFDFDSSGRLLVGPPDVLSRADITAIKTNRHELARLTRYCQAHRGVQ